MRVNVRYFAIVREIAGKQHDSLELEPGITVSGLFDLLAQREPGLQSLRHGLVFMVNHSYANADQVLNDGDEFALIPPVSGGTGNRYWVQYEPIDVRAVEALVDTPAAGAVVTFTGRVREVARGRPVKALDYEIYEEAAAPLLEQIGGELAGQWDLAGSAIVHRGGYLTPGEASVVIVVASAHRAPAFAACSYAIERIKEIVPVWKKEYYDDGETWVGSEAEYQQLLKTQTST